MKTFLAILRNSAIALLLCMFAWVEAFAEKTEVGGVVRDSLTKETLPYAAVYFENTDVGTACDKNGTFSLSTDKSGYLVFSMVGFKDKKVYVNADGKRKTLKVDLNLEEYYLDEVVVSKRRRQRYSKKNNPALDMIRKVIENKDRTAITNHEYYQCDKYQKITYAWNGFEAGKFGLLNKRFGFLYDHIDTTQKGRSILPLGLREVASTLYWQSSPERMRTVVHAKKFDGIDELLPQEGVQNMFDEFIRGVDIFENDIVMFATHFVSPLSNVAPAFYKFFALDTLEINGVRCVNIAFTPHTTEAYGFTGSLYVSLDSSYAVKRAHFNLPKNINLNFVESMSFDQDFDYAQDGTRMLTKDFVSAAFFVPAAPRVYGERLNAYRNYSFEKPVNTVLFDFPDPVVDESSARKVSSVEWDSLRYEPLSEQEARTRLLMRELRQVPIYRFTEGFVKICTNNFIPTKKEGSQFDIGPVFSMISANDLEGFRLRFGGETTTAFDKHFFLSAYAAYGFKDKRPKGMGSIEYSFNDKEKYHVEFPVHSLTVYCKYDVDKVGDENYSTVGGNAISSLFSRSDDRDAIYARVAGISYLHEYHSGFSMRAHFNYKTSYSTFLTNFQKYDERGVLSDCDNYSMGALKLSLRFAPKEKFYQSRLHRFTLNKEVPILTLSHSVALDGYVGSDYTCNKTELGFEKRMWFSYFGYVDLLLKGVKVWNKVPYTLLDIPIASSSYFIDNEEFNLMDPVEFINDQSVSWYLTYYMNGLVLNRIPLIRKLQLREVFAFRGLWGGLDRRNDPSLADNPAGLFAFPTGTYRMDDRPYMEISAGVENIFKVFRIDYVWRLTYREHADVDTRGVRFGVHFNF
ncbi:MAG: carboxypeptidase-like regulatory domain-containing protein [Paludibacteraceae bacterium]|nr:carboxypeptidase-like regulatory domain-containing protein [Paludibacteraceae bacterium]